MSLLKGLFDSSVWLPPPDLTISQWADEYRRIPPEASSEPGIWHTSRAEYQRSVMDAVSDKLVERVIMMTSAQVGKTEIILNTIGYYVDKEPCPILLLNPTLEMGESFSKDRLAPMIRDTPCLTSKIMPPRMRDSGNTLLHKKFPGGHITISGANSPASLASRPIRVLLCDEVDRYPETARNAQSKEGEGDPLSLAMKRTQNFWNRRILLVSTPTLKGMSRIAQEFENSSREEWSVPCPTCGELNAYDWERIEYKGKTEPVMRCAYCGHEHDEYEWKGMQSKGEWVSGNPAVKNIRGFHMNSFASPWASWPDLISQYHEAYNNGEEQLKVWVNTVLGIPYESKEGIVELEGLLTHAEEYKAEVPDEVRVLTCGVDVQDDRLEFEVVGWGKRHESWGIYYGVIYGSPGNNDVWQELDVYLDKEWKYANDESLRISCTCIDSGGHFTDEVYKYCQLRVRQNVFAVIGRGAMGLPSVSRPTRNNRRKVMLFTLGVTALKGVLHSRLNAEKKEPGYCHFPSGESGIKRGYDRKYYQGLLSERMQIVRKRGRDVITWEVRDRKIRNEPLDCRVYATGAYEILSPALEKQKRAIREPKKEEKMKELPLRGIRIMRGGLKM